MPQLMPLNWMFSLFMVGFLMMICFYLYCLKVMLQLNISNKYYFSDKYNWMW